MIDVTPMRAVSAGLVYGVFALLLVPTAHADDAGWLFTPDMDDVTLVQSPQRSQLAWELPGSFSKGGETVSGDFIIRPTGGDLYQPDFQFDSPNTNRTSAMYAYGSQTGSGYGVADYFFSEHGLHDISVSGGRLLTGGAGISVPSWILGAADYSDAITWQEVLTGSPDGNSLDFTNALNLGPGSSWSSPVSDYGAMTPIMYDDQPMWHFSDVRFTDLSGDTLTGTAYLNSVAGALGLYNEEFVATSGATYALDEYGFGFSTWYYSPGNGSAATELLHTPLGNLNISDLSWLFTVPDYTGGTPDEATSVLHTLLDNSALVDAFAYGQSILDGAT